MAREVRKKKRAHPVEDAVFRYSRPVFGLAAILVAALLARVAPLLAAGALVLGLYILYRRRRG